MEARKVLIAFLAITVSCCAISLSHAASFRSRNFVVSAADAQLAEKVVQLAEQYRKDLALEWLGHELPAWSQPCPITVNEGGGAGGATSFAFYNRVPMNWTMEIQGSRERILDSVLPHEILHTVFATHFGRPLPRWADEGACTTVEHASERNKNTDLLYRFLTTDRGIAFNRMFAMKEYPSDVLPLYAQGYSLARFLIAQGGKRKYVDFVSAGMDSNNWTRSLYEAYGFKSLGNLQVAWLDWVRDGSDPAKILDHTEVILASHEQPAADKTIMRGQSPEVKQPPVQPSSQLASNPANNTLSGRLVPINHVQQPVGQQPAENFYANGGQTATTQLQTQPVSTTAVAETAQPDAADNDQVLMQWSRTSVAAPAYYLPGGTSLYR